MELLSFKRILLKAIIKVEHTGTGGDRGEGKLRIPSHKNHHSSPHLPLLDFYV